MNHTALACLAVGVVAWSCPITVFSQTLDFHGQLSSWFILNSERPSTGALGLRYLPTLTLEKKLPDERIVDAEVSMNAYASAQAPDWSDLQATAAAKPYRVWARYKTSRFEARIGLQRISFGSASLLRPLMWFDSVDPRDPLQITDGVKGALLRYYLPSNVTVWAWGLFGNNSLKGWETNPTREKTPEFGGRVQVPLSRGEMAFTTHDRWADLSKGPVGNVALENPVAQESRYALDGKWDLGIGLWFEGVLTHQRNPDVARPDQRALNVGADYTFSVGKGLRVVGEYFDLENAHRILGAGEGTRLLASLVSYPVGLLDTVSGIVYVDSTHHDAYRFISWQRTYDRWQFYGMGFWNPHQAAIYQGQTGQSAGQGLAISPAQPGQSAGQSPLAGRGVQVMAVFHH